MPDNLGVRRACNPCHWVHKVKGGEPLSVAICSLCGEINWTLLREDLAKLLSEHSLVHERYAEVEHLISGDGEISHVLSGPNNLGLPGAFAAEDGSVICWSGQNYVPQQPEPTNTSERPEDATRRYARQLVALQEGLLNRGVSLAFVPEEGLVPKVLEELDRLVKRCQDLERTLRSERDPG